MFVVEACSGSCPCGYARPVSNLDAHRAPAPPAAAGPGRDRFADLLRTVALGAVILGHWVMGAVRVDQTDGLVVDNLLNSQRWLWPATWVLVLIGLFFFVGGFSNATSLTRARARGVGDGAWVRRRLAGLLRPVAPFVLACVAVVLVALWLGAPRTLTLTVAVVVLMPLWFVAVYAVLAAITPTMLRLDRRFGVRVMVVLAAGAVGVDLLRIATDNTYAGYANYVLVWGLAQQLGFAYRDGRLTRLRPWALALWGGLALAALVAVTASPMWAESMVGLSGERSNMNPPSVPSLLHLLVQVPAVLLIRPWLVPRLDGPRVAPVLDRAAALSMRAFLWHLPVAVVVTGALYVSGVPFPTPGSAAWWWSRPAVLALFALVLWLVLRGRSGRRRRTAQPDVVARLADGRGDDAPALQVAEDPAAQAEPEH